MVAPAKKRPNRLCLLQESLPSSKVAFLKARYQKSLETLACHSGSRWHLFRTHSQIWNWKRLACDLLRPKSSRILGVASAGCMVVFQNLWLLS